MSPFAQTMFGSASRPRNLKGVLEQHIVIVNIVTLALVLVIGFLYILQVNGAVTKGYQIRDLETTIEGLTLENQRLEVVARKAQSLEHIDRSVKMLGFVEAGSPVYKSDSDASVALLE